MYYNRLDNTLHRYYHDPYDSLLAVMREIGIQEIGREYMVETGSFAWTRS